MQQAKHNVTQSSTGETNVRVYVTQAKGPGVRYQVPRIRGLIRSDLSGIEHPRALSTLRHNVNMHMKKVHNKKADAAAAAAAADDVPPPSMSPR